MRRVISSFLPTLRALGAAAIALTALALPRQASANTVYSPFGIWDDVDVYIVLVFDPNGLVVRPAALTIRRSDNACGVGLFASDDAGNLTESIAYVAGHGNDTISMWNETAWTSFQCNEFTFAVKALNTDRRQVSLYGSWGNDRINEFLYPTAMFGGQGHDVFVVENQQWGAKSQISGGDGDDVFHVHTSFAQLFGDRGDDHFCVYDFRPTGMYGGDGQDSANGNASSTDIIEEYVDYCPPL